VSNKANSPPKLQPQAPPPLNQQPMRHFSSPRNQIEAMPPFPPIVPASRSLHVPIPARAILDASVRHPVFFTDRLVKAPTGVNAGSMNWGSPVALGYVFEEGGRREGGSRL